MNYLEIDIRVGIVMDLTVWLLCLDCLMGGSLRIFELWAGKAFESSELNVGFWKIILRAKKPVLKVPQQLC